MILAPLVGSIAQLFRPARWMTLLSAGIPIVCLIAFLFQGDWSLGKDIYSLKSEWVPHYQAEIFFRLNGLNVLPLLSLCGVSMFFLVSFFKKETFGQALFGLILLVQSFMTIALLSGDMFVQMVFWGATAVPLYFLSALFGSKNGKAGFHFLIYSILGTFFVFIGVLLIYYFSTPHTFDMTQIHSGQFQQSSQTVLGMSIPEWSFVFICLGFFLRFPLFPFSGWMATLADELSVEMLVVHLGLFLSSTSFIFTQLAISVFSNQINSYHMVFWIMGLVSAFLGSLQLVHRKSFSQILNAIGMMFTGATLIALGSAGALGTLSIGMMSVTVGVSVAGLAWIYSCLQQRDYSWDQAGWKSSGIFFSAQSVVFANLAVVPATSSFIPVALLLSGTFEKAPVIAIIYVVIRLIAVYGIFRVHQEKVLGGEGTKLNLDFREASVGVLLIVLTLLMGVWPREITKISQPAVGELIKNLTQ